MSLLSFSSVPRAAASIIKALGLVNQVGMLCVVMDVKWDFLDLVIDFLIYNAVFRSVKSYDLPESIEAGKQRKDLPRFPEVWLSV